MKDITEFIQSVGFPIFVAVYVLLRLERTIKSLTEVVDKLREKGPFDCPFIDDLKSKKKSKSETQNG